jgi:RNA-directed DNA polymerase
VRFDLENFFWQIDARRVRGIFRALGYPSPIDRMLAGLATTLTPSAVRREASSRLAVAERHAFRALLTGRHLPQGAPSSPALANLCAFALDRRIAGLAARFGARYTRYADDLAFSGERDFERALDRFMPSVAAIALAEGFRVRHHKTRVMRSGARQELCGVVVNRRPSLRRAEIERLEATLFNCVRSGPETQNRDRHPDFRAHLRGRIEWLAHLAPQRAAPLRELFARIEW